MITCYVASAHDLPVADSTVHLILESVPYYRLRRYEGEQATDWPQVVMKNPFDAAMSLAVPGMTCALGWEARPLEYLAHLILCLREHRRVLRDDGVLFLNIGERWVNKEAQLLPQQLVMLAQADGWHVRHASIPWIKLNSLPNSNRDRLVMMHEDILMLTKSRHYFFDPDAIRQPVLESNRRKGGKATYTANGSVRHGRDSRTLHQPGDERGRLCRTSDVWVDSVQAVIKHLENYSMQLRQMLDNRNGAVTDDEDNLSGMLVNIEAYRGAHYAGWPERLVELLIRAGTSEDGCCPECGRQWVNGEAGCACGLEPSPSIVGDFFAGSGTTGRVAMRLRRRAILADISQFYMSDLATERLSGVQLEMF